MSGWVYLLIGGIAQFAGREAGNMSETVPFQWFHVDAERTCHGVAGEGEVRSVGRITDAAHLTACAEVEHYGVAGSKGETLVGSQFIVPLEHTAHFYVTLLVERQRVARKGIVVDCPIVGEGRSTYVFDYKRICIVAVAGVGAVELPRQRHRTFVDHCRSRQREQQRCER